MSEKYSWDDMSLCKGCHYADKSPDVCHAWGEPKEKPAPMLDEEDCSRRITDEKWRRVQDGRKESFVSDPELYSICRGCRSHVQNTNECFRSIIPLPGQCAYFERE